MLSDVVHAPKNPEVITQESASVPLEDAVIETAPQPLFEEPPPGEILDMIRNQYQESLYMSKVRAGCLAKFVIPFADKTRRRWHILQRGRYRELALLSAILMTLRPAHLALPRT